jgi:hypothetical protein
MRTRRRKSPIVRGVLETWPFFAREREKDGEPVIGTGCKTVEDNEHNQEVSCCTAETLLYSLGEPKTFPAICPRSKLL